MSPEPRFRAAAPCLALTLLLALPALAPRAAAAEGAPRRLSLDEAVARALEKDEDVIVERRALDAAQAAVSGAGGAYDPLLSVETGYRRTSTPVNSAFSGAPAGEAAPTTKAATASASIRRLLPSGGEVEVHATQARLESDASFDLLSPVWDSRLGVEFRQPLLRSRGIDAARLGLRVAAADRDRAAASLRHQVTDTVAAVERAYWSLVAARREVEVQAESVRLAEEQLHETEIRIQGGATPEAEIAQPRAELERRRGDLLAAREAVARAENVLKLLVLSDDDGDAWVEPLVPEGLPEDLPEGAPEVDAGPVDVAAALEAALANRAELEAAAAVVERRRAERELAGDEVRPGLDLVLSYDRYGLAGSRNPAAGSVTGFPTAVPAGLEGSWNDAVEQLADGDFDDARAALVFTLPLGNRAAKAAALEAASAEAQSAALLARARKAVRAQVLDAVAGLETAEARIEASRAARAAAEVQLSAEQDRFDVGLSTNFLVLTRQNELASARLAEIEALTDYRTARTELGRATGSLLTDRGIEVQDR